MHSDPLGDRLRLFTVYFRVRGIKIATSINKNAKFWVIFVSYSLYLFANLRRFFVAFIAFGSGSYLILVLFY